MILDAFEVEKSPREPKKEQMIKESDQRGAFVPLWQQNIKKKTIIVQ